jgi:hypothetical protein
VRSFVVLVIVLCACDRGTPSAGRVALRIDPDEARAALVMAETPSDAAFARLVATPGYRRLRIREHAMGRSFEDADMRAFLASPDLTARRRALADALARWSNVDLGAIGARVLPYLPAEAKLAATVYPVIKPKPNSFVSFDDEGAAIFVSVDPAQSAAQFENVVAHELHHIGFASINSPPCTAPPAVCAARTWSGGFSEGFAMLAAAGGPDVHPHRDSPAADRARWDRDVARFDDDLRSVQQFLREVASGALDETAARTRAMTFYGVQGPWYTVGWSMAVAIERCFGRERLIAAMRQPWTVLRLYNDARARCATPGPTATWDPALVATLEQAR